MPEDIAYEMYKRAVGVCQALYDPSEIVYGVNQQGFFDFKHDISGLLQEVGMELRSGREEGGPGKQWVILVNNDPNDVALQASDLTPLEIAYYREVIQAIMSSYPANSIGSTRALRLTTTLKANMTRLAAEALLGSLTSRGWLAKSKRGRYSLAPRAMMELETYLRQEFEEWVHKCRKCEGMILSGVVCNHGNCDTHLHEYCYDLLRRSARNACPTCTTSFADHPPRPVGEGAVPRIEDDWQGGGNGKKRKRASRGGQSAAQEDEEQSEGEEEEGGVPDSMDGVGEGKENWASSRSRVARGTVIPETQLEDDDGEEDEDHETKPLARRRR
ncbi:MAG: hypothetical protein TREMPRED_002588 [Tremellales sp. Tagirdzhanova-0007]|nr:MAG: hypothetical protein TREMPRED_002588 [Tremellales sp. Tagirdzhanova-0007]